MTEIKEAIAEVPALEHNEEEDTFTIRFDDVEDVYDSYTVSPIVKTFINFEILVRRKNIHEQEHGRVSRHEVLGYAYDEQGEEYDVTWEWIQECRDWIQQEF